MSANKSQPPAPQFVTPAWLSHRTAVWLTPIFLFLGIECWLVVGKGNYGHQNKPLMILAAIICGLIPPIRRAFNWLWQSVENPSPRARTFIAILIAIASALFLYWTQRFEKTPFQPKFHDEFSYLIQMRMLATGHLWMPPLPLPDFFDSFYIFVTPVYASMYFPGAAIMYVPALLLHLPYYIAPLLASGICAALLYLIITEILDGSSALLAVLILLSMGMFRMMSIMAMSQTPTLLLGLTMTWSLLRWRREHRARWLLLLGTSAGWAAITRPADALCFAIVVASVLAMDLRHSPMRAWLKTAVCILIAAIPFLTLQLIVNRNITGDFLTSPFTRYTDLNYPGAIGFHQGDAPLHVSNVPEKQLFYEQFVKGVVEQHQLKNLISIGLSGEWAAVSTAAIPDAFFWLIIPLSILTLWDRRLWAVWGMLPLYLIVLAGYSFSAVLPHYVVVVMAAMILLCILPIRFLTGTFPAKTPMIRTMFGLGIIALTLAAMPQFNRIVHDQYFETPELEQINQTLSQNASSPAVVMFHFNRDALINGQRVTNDPSVEPVFNSDVAWPDNAAIIRAHDLNENISAIGKPGDLDAPLYNYYARIAPNRVFYLYDRAATRTTKLRRLGTAAQLAHDTK
jgi:Dolichyl-phosphate-mannose-protein mannosyltransferase